MARCILLYRLQYIQSTPTAIVQRFSSALDIISDIFTKQTPRCFFSIFLSACLSVSTFFMTYLVVHLILCVDICIVAFWNSCETIFFPSSIHECVCERVKSRAISKKHLLFYIQIFAHKNIKSFVAIAWCCYCCCWLYKVKSGKIEGRGQNECDIYQMQISWCINFEISAWALWNFFPCLFMD